MESKKNFGSIPKGYALTLCGGFLWAVGGSCGQQIFTQYNTTSNWLIPIRILLSGLLLLGISKCMGKPLGEVFKNRKDTRDLILFSLFGAGASQYTYYTCIQYSNTAFATVISYIFPVLILLYHMIRNRRAPRFYELISVILVTLGAFTCTTYWDFSSLSISGIALVVGLLCALASAYNTIKPQALLQKYPLVAIMGWSMTISGVVLFILCRPWTIAVQVDANLILLMAAIIIGGTILGFSFYQAGVRIIGSLAGGIMAAVEPVGAVLIAVVFLKVQLNPMDFLGFALILVTIPIIAVGQHREIQMKLSDS